MPFSPLALGPELERAFAALGYAQPFPVQAQAIPAALAGRDLVVQAPTGSGKTVAFLAPILRALARPDAPPRVGNGIRALVLVPTRELAAQVEDRARGLMQHLSGRLKVVTAFGGVSENPQMLALRGGADLVIATPGRLLHLLGLNALTLSHLRHLVIDEADKLLDLGFAEEMGELRRQLPAVRQTMLFSATMNTAVQEVVQAFLRDPERIVVEAAPELPFAIEETAYLLPMEHKGPFLRELLNRERWPQVLIFVASGRRADNVVLKLGKHGIHARAIHGDKSQGARTEVLNLFRQGRLRVLVATDLIARGIDIGGLPCVLNYDLPRSPRDYVHRVGRTGRAGQSGIGISLVAPDEEHHLGVIEKKVGRKFHRERIEA